MASKFEEALFRACGKDDKFHVRLAEKLDTRSLRNLRAVSNTLKTFVDKHGELAFPDVFIHAPVREGETTQGMDTVAPFCRNLTITICKPKEEPPPAEPTPPPLSPSSKKSKRRSNVFNRFSTIKKIWNTSMDVLALGPVPTDPQPDPQTSAVNLDPDALEMDLNTWHHLLNQFASLRTLTLRLPTADPTWPGRQTPEHTLLLLRICLERSRPRNLHTLTLSPIHAMGILHLRWSSFGAFTEVPSPRNMRLWTSLTTLDLRIINPLSQIDAIKTRMFLSILHTYLSSFTRTLQTLKFLWLGSKPGPSPLCLEDEPSLSHRAPLHWPRLEEFWFGNITLPNKTTSLIPDVAPRCRVVKALRSTHRFSRFEGKGEESWYDVPMERVLARRRRASLAASSIYSQPAGDDSGRGSMVSRASRVVPFMLDVKGQGEIVQPKTYKGKGKGKQRD